MVSSGGAPTASRPEDFGHSDPARALTATEAMLAGLWRDLVQVAPTRPSDDFMSLGGHSLLVAQLAWRLRQTMGIAVRIGDLQAASRLEAMALLVDAAPRTRDSTPRRPATEATDVDGVACQIELGTWRLDDVERFIASLDVSPLSAGDRVARTALAFWGTPFQFESRRPLPLRGRLPVRLGAFDCVTFVYTALALGLSRSFGGFVKALRALRYRDPERTILDSDPESGSIFDFVEESLIVNAVERGLLTDVTPEIAQGAPLEKVEVNLIARRRDVSLDPLELWATPKLGAAPVSMSFLPRAAFHRLGPQTALRSGDVIIMARSAGETGQVVDHIGFAHVDETGSYLLQSTRHFAWSASAVAPRPPRYTGVFYDEARRCEQIGVGVGGAFVGDGVSFTRDGLAYHGYEAGGRRSLVDYLDGAGFGRVLILRPAW